MSCVAILAAVLVAHAENLKVARAYADMRRLCRWHVSYLNGHGTPAKEYLRELEKSKPAVDKLLFYEYYIKCVHRETAAR